MHHFIFPTADTWISSGSSTIDGESFKDQNFGQDEILELKKEFYNKAFHHQTRVLINFNGNDLTELSKSIHNGNIGRPTLTQENVSGSRFFLKLYEAEGNKELSTEYTLKAYPLSQSWDEGRGKFGDNPKVLNGCSWENRSYPDNGNAISWSNVDGTQHHGGYYISMSGEASQSFSYQSPDVEMEITPIVANWFNGTNTNHGLLLKFSGSQETDETTFGNLKFFSRNTHTIYSPRLEVRWDDHLPCTGSNTGSLNELTMSGLADNYISMPGLRDSYKQTERVKFRIKPRERYIQKTFSRSVQTLTGSFIPEGKGFYSIKDVTTDETIVPFSTYTSMSCDTKGNYFIQWLDGFYPDRVYKILYKLKYDDNQEQIFDDNFEFIVKR